MPASQFTFRLSFFNLCLFLASGVQLPFLPLWLQSRGLGTAEIALVVAAMTGIRVVAAPLGAYLAEAINDRRRVMIVASFASFFAYVAMAFVDGFWPIIIAGTTATAFYSPVLPLTEAFSVEGSAHHGTDYGRIRLWASISFLTGGMVGGVLLEILPISWAIVLIATGQAGLALASLILPDDPVRRATHQPRARVGEVAAVMFGGSFIIFLAAAGIGQASHGLNYAFASVHWDRLGYGEATIGELWAAAVIAETVFFAFSARLVRNTAPAVLIAIGVAGGLVRWLVLGLDPPLPVLFLAQMLHASSFALTHLGTMRYVQQAVPAGMRNTVQAFYSALAGGILLSSVMWASGTLYAGLGGSAYFVMAGLSAIALGLALILVRVNPRGFAAAGT